MSTARGIVDKATLRRAVLSRRAALPSDQRAQAETASAQALLPHAHGRVAAYVSIGTEPGTAALLAALAERSVEVLLPVLLPDGDLDWARAAEGVAPSRSGLLEPVAARLGPDAVADCSLVVVPALAVDRAGHRLGRGGGAYDRALPRTRGWIVALLHDGEAVPELPTEPHDAPVHALVAPKRGLVRLRPHPADGVGVVPGGKDSS